MYLHKPEEYKKKVSGEHSIFHFQRCFRLFLYWTLVLFLIKPRFFLINRVRSKVCNRRCYKGARARIRREETEWEFILRRELHVGLQRRRSTWHGTIVFRFIIAKSFKHYEFLLLWNGRALSVSGVRSLKYSFTKLAQKLVVSLLSIHTLPNFLYISLWDQGLWNLDLGLITILFRSLLPL